MKNKKAIKIRVLDYLVITAGSLIYAAGVAMFLDPNNLAAGGVSGIAIILNKFVDVLNVGLMIIILNIPIMILGVINFGVRFLLSTIYALLLSSGAMELFSLLDPVTTDPLLAAVAGGALQGIGVGLVFRHGGTTGGADVIVRILKKRFRYLKTGTLFIVIDGVIIIASGIAFQKIDTALYASIGLMVYMMMFNVVLYGGDGARLVYIISEKKEAIAARILEELDAGATVLEGRGAYTGNKKDVLMAVLRTRSLPEARDIVKEEDQKAFMIVTQASSVFGEGFKSHNSEDL